MGLLKIIFVISLISLSAGELARFQSGSGVNITFNNIAVGILILCWLIYSWKKKLLKNNSLVKPIFIFIAVCLLSLLINLKVLNLSNFIIAFLYLLRLIFYMSLFFVVFSFDDAFKKKIPLYMIFSGIFVVLAGLIQFVIYPSLYGLIYLEWDEHMRRMFSTFFDPNFLGIFLVLNLMLILGVFLYQFGKKRDLGILGGLGILGVLNFVAIFLTYSRSALLALTAGSIIFLTMYGKKKLILVFLSIIFLSVYLFYSINKSDTTTVFRDISSEARVGSTLSTFPIIKDNLLVGVGFNAYRYAQLRYGILKNDARWEASHSGAGTDNSFLFILATTGVIGFITFIYLWWKIIKSQLNIFSGKSNNYQKMISAVTVSSIGGVFVSSLFINSLFYPFIMYWIWILIGLSSNFKENI